MKPERFRRTISVAASSAIAPEVTALVKSLSPLVRAALTANVLTEVVTR